MNYSINDEYDKYLLNTYDNSSCIIFDGHGSFYSGRTKFFKLFSCLPRIHIFSLADKDVIYYNKLTYNIKFGNDVFESFNVDITGTLIDFKNGEFIRDQVTGYNIKDAEIYKKTIDCFCLFLKKENTIILNKLNENTDSIINKYYQSIYKKAKSDIINNYQQFFNNEYIIYNNNVNKKIVPILITKKMNKIINKKKNIQKINMYF
jgi:hypothetical protein